jgi:hypothetical protein
MDIAGLNAALIVVVGVMTIVGLANLLDYGLRTMAEDKATRAEEARFRKWGLPAPKSPEEPKSDEGLWHF